VGEFKLCSDSALTPNRGEFQVLLETPPSEQIGHSPEHDVGVSELDGTKGKNALLALVIHLGLVHLGTIGMF